MKNINIVRGTLAGALRFIYISKLQKISLALLFPLFFSTSFCQTKYQEDFNFYWKTIEDNYAYFDNLQTNWEKAKAVYEPMVDTCTTRNGFIGVLEITLNEFYNGHNFLNTNTDASNRLIPSGSDLKIIYRNGNFIIDEMRENFNADLCGLKKGMQVVSYNDQPVDEAIKKFLPRSITNYNTKIYEYASNMLLAGTHNTKRKITVKVNGTTKDFFPDSIPNRTEENYQDVLEWKILQKNIGYIRINNSLGNDELIKRFDSVLDSLLNTTGLILDLRETPSGGTSTIARAIMGRFIEKEMPYQKHLYVAEEKETGIKRTTLELVSPRQTIYNKPLIVLVGYWTGSMGEGITIGFDAMHRGTIVGTKMAGLLGEIFTFETPGLKIPFSFPCVKLQTINGLPREDYLPAVQVNDQSESLEKAIGLLTAKPK
jgi:carboxyl-terminal processing protease